MLGLRQDDGYGKIHLQFDYDNSTLPSAVYYSACSVATWIKSTYFPYRRRGAGRRAVYNANQVTVNTYINPDKEIAIQINTPTQTLKYTQITNILPPYLTKYLITPYTKRK